MGSPLNGLIATEDTLRLLAQQLIDSQQGLQKIGEELQSEPLRLRFLAESLERARFRGDIESILHHEGERDLNLSGTAEAAVIRAWAGLKHALGGGDHTLLGTAEEAERALADAYTAALQRDLPHPVRETLTIQAAAVNQFLDFVAGARS
jgi:uncharacterized protein (TIGR02284 family)